MSASVLVTGAIFRAPEQRTSKAGKSYVTATIRVRTGEATDWWKVVAFGQTACDELLRLGDGDAVAIQGQLKVETYARDGETKLSLGVTADQVLPLKPPPKTRERKTAEAKAPPAHQAVHDSAGSYDDPIPF